MVPEILNKSLSSPYVGGLLSNDTLMSYTVYTYDASYYRSFMIVYIVLGVVFGLIFLGGCIAVCVKGGTTVIPGRVIQAGGAMLPGSTITSPPGIVQYGVVGAPPQYKS